MCVCVCVSYISLSMVRCWGRHRGSRSISRLLLDLLLPLLLLLRLLVVLFGPAGSGVTAGVRTFNSITGKGGVGAERPVLSYRCDSGECHQGPCWSVVIVCLFVCLPARWVWISRSWNWWLDLIWQADVLAAAATPGSPQDPAVHASIQEQVSRWLIRRRLS